MRKHLLPVVLLSSILLVSSVMPLRADELQDAINQQNQLQQKQNQAQGQLNQLTYTADKLKKQIQDLGTQITVAQTSLKDKQSAYEKSQVEVETAQKELAQKQANLDQRRETLRQRVRGIYEEGQISYLEILLQSTDLGDFISRLEYFGKLVANDRNIMTDIQTEKDQVAKKAKELQDRRDKAAQLQAQAAEAKADLDSKKKQQESALAQNKKAQLDIFEEIDRMKVDSDAIANKIRQLSKAKGVLGTINTYPLPGHTEISDPYGWRIHPITKKKSLHTGTDIPAPSGTKILAAGDGEVIMAGWYGAYGNAIIIDHGGGYTTLYGHQSKLGVSVGDSVQAGQVIGYVGSTGWSTGPHLHFEVRLNGNPTDPLQFFR